jgi:hypothetical protein
VSSRPASGSAAGTGAGVVPGSVGVAPGSVGVAPGSVGAVPGSLGVAPGLDGAPSDGVPVPGACFGAGVGAGAGFAGPPRGLGARCGGSVRGCVVGRRRFSLSGDVLTGEVFTGDVFTV